MTTVEDYLDDLESTLEYVDKSQVLQSDYDMIVSFNASINNGKALTEKQGKCAISLIEKYQKYLGYGIPTPHRFRHPFRIIENRQTISIDDDILVVYFPWNGTYIDNIRAYKNSSIGKVIYNKEKTRWEFALSEVNVTWVVTWGQINNFVITSEVTELYNKILECEMTPCSIQLVQTETGYTITNAAQSLLDYVETNLGGFGLNNIDTLVDNAGVLGYTVDESITGSNPLVQVFGPNRVEFLTPTIENLESVLEYARIVNRYPVVIYYPSVSQNRIAIVRKINELYNPCEIIMANGEYHRSMIAKAKIIFIDKSYNKLMLECLPSNIPLLVTYNQLLLNGHNGKLLLSSDRIVYMCKSKIITD
jgi:hypothetical protein